MGSCSMYKPVIVVIAFNRINSLKRLLASLNKANYPSNVKLIISIDNGDNNEIKNFAEAFFWNYGEKEVIYHQKHLGLKYHVLKCGDLTQKYDSVILLEDDVYVSPVFYDYAVLALNYYHTDDKIAGIGLYSDKSNFFINLPFSPIIDESDTYFLQIPVSWGEAWTKKQWNGFRNWLKSSELKNITLSQLKQKKIPSSILAWHNAWTKFFFIYMIETNRYFVYPKYSLTTNFHDIGVHTTKKNTFYQVPLQLHKKEYTFKSLETSLAVYDAYFEILPDRLNVFSKQLQKYHYEVDLYGLKEPEKLSCEYILTSKECQSYLFSYSREMKPLEMNIINEIPGKGLFFCKKTSLKPINKISNYKLYIKAFFFFYKELTFKELILFWSYKIAKFLEF